MRERHHKALDKVRKEGQEEAELKFIEEKGNLQQKFDIEKEELLKELK